MVATLEELKPDQRPDFCIKVNFKRGTKNPERVFRVAANFIEALQGLDVLLVGSIDSQIKPVLLLEEVESGSIKIWLKQFLEAVDDGALKSLDWKPAVGKYLVKAKHRMIGYLEKHEGLESAEALHGLSSELHALARETDAKKLPAYRPSSPSDLAVSLKRISESLEPLGEDGSVSIASDEGENTAPSTLSITQESITAVLAGESITNEVEKILMVRRPDFLGETMWEFRHEKKSFSAKIEDEKWLEGFHNRQHNIQPGDALRVKILETITYGKDGEVISESRTISRVIGVIRETLHSLPLE